MATGERCSPTAYRRWPVIAYGGSAVLAVWIVVVAVVWSPTEAAGLFLALLPAVVVAVGLARVTRGRPAGPVFERAEERRIAEAVAKLTAVAVFGVAIGSVNLVVPLPLFAAGYSLVLATLIGVTSWTIAAEVLVVMRAGARRDPTD